MKLIIRKWANSMNVSSYFNLRSRKASVFLITLLSLLLATHGPMVSFTSAQTAIDGEKVKQKVLKELDRRIAVQQKYLDNAKKRNTSVDKNFEQTIELEERFNKSTAVNTSVVATKAASDDSKKRQQKSEEVMQKTLDGLKTLRSQVSSATTYAALQKLANNTDAQYGLNRLVQVQAAVVTAVDNAKAASVALQNVVKNHRKVLQTQSTCLGDAKSTTNVSEACKAYIKQAPETSEEMNSRLNASLDRAEMRAKSYAAVADSAVILLGAVSDGFTNIVITKLGVTTADMNTLHQVDLQKMKSIDQSVDGLSASLSSIVSQLNLASSMLNGASADVKSATISS